MKVVPQWSVYVLRHPRTGEIRYVGWTSRRASVRLRAHIYTAVNAGRLRGSHKNRWVLSLLSIGLQPDLEIVESGTGDGWAESEKRWIATLRANGANLLNRSDGGEGNPGYIFTPEVRQKISQKNTGRTITLEHKAKWIAAAVAANTGSHWTEERKRQQSDMRRGIPRPPGVIAKLQAHNKGRTLSAETRAKIAAARKGTKASSETRAKMSESGKRLHSIESQAGRREWMKSGNIARWRNRAGGLSNAK